MSSVEAFMFPTSDKPVGMTKLKMNYAKLAKHENWLSLVMRDGMPSRNHKDI